MYLFLDAFVFPFLHDSLCVAHYRPIRFAVYLISELEGDA